MIKRIGISALLVISCNLAYAETKFDGFYAGIQAGYADGKDKGKEYNNDIFSGFTQKTTPDGGLFGAYLGYNKVFENSLLVGLEADYELRDGDDKSFQKNQGRYDPQYTAKTELKDAASVRARLGYVFNEGKTLGYLTAGYAMVNIKRTMTDALNEGLASVPSQSERKWHQGWTVGFGAEHFIADKISLKADYRYSGYDRRTINSYEVFNELPGDAYTQKQKYQDEQSLRLGIAYHF